jgi:hypothetical protein
VAGDSELRERICAGLAGDDVGARRDASLLAYQRYAGQLRRVAWRRNSTTADEAVSELFARLISTPRQVSPAGLGSYVHRAVASIQREMGREARSGRVTVRIDLQADLARGAPELWLAEHLEDMRRAGVGEEERRLVALLASGLTFEEAGRRLRPGLKEPGAWAVRRALHLEKSLRLYWGKGRPDDKAD